MLTAVQKKKQRLYNTYPQSAGPWQGYYSHLLYTVYGPEWKIWCVASREESQDAISLNRRETLHAQCTLSRGMHLVISIQSDCCVTKEKNASERSLNFLTSAHWLKLTVWRGHGCQFWMLQNFESQLPYILHQKGHFHLLTSFLRKLTYRLNTSPVWSSTPAYTKYHSSHYLVP